MLMHVKVGQQVKNLTPRMMDWERSVVLRIDGASYQHFSLANKLKRPEGDVLYFTAVKYKHKDSERALLTVQNDKVLGVQTLD